MANDKVDLEADARDYHADLSKREHVARELDRYDMCVAGHITNIVNTFDRLNKDVRDYCFVEQLQLDDGSYNGKSEIKFFWQRIRS